ncbi:radical SAM family heme chaperone HemW [Pedobacter flavus]|uniref:Heme chaperone HemW n=1 Tax=Pedobacter flavus TaxID=3113906 RepID=A0ABU7GYM0_9SPHI|nr:radical SAM family heme chaperone HemW [Pedobacter sp. VNH31]MEE1884096.1 radical SAM family heme chaperone HemW [Pedobacter sp. VNH31]
MAGIYIHIPFCKKACHYCDFHFSTTLNNMDEMVQAICNELILKKNRFNDSIGSIYFGGGTPSLLSETAFGKIFNTIFKNYTVNSNSEITIEANPDDLDNQRITMFRQFPVNRFSIGVQSFFEEDLIWMNRAHNASEAESSIKRAQDKGFENLTIDLIYGYPLLSDKKWRSNLNKAIELNIPHLSAYAMTVEAKTAMAHAIKLGKQPNIDDEQSAQQFLFMVNTLQKANFEQYEISNFAKEGKYAVHNTNYWKGIPFLGIGPSAHGYDGKSRQYNISNNPIYIKNLLQNKLAETIEILSLADQFNEYIMTQLRTMWGLDLLYIEQKFGLSAKKHFINNIQKHLKNENLVQENNNFYLSANGKLYADRVASDLFLEMEDFEN